jgi:hypothetical protein
MEKKSLVLPQTKPQSQNESDNIDPRDSQSNISGMGGALKGGRSQIIGLNSQGEVVKNHPCIEGFNQENPDEIVCLILIKSGTLILQGCSLSVESIKNNLKFKAPCIYQKPDTTSFIQRCSFRGGGMRNAMTAGMFI